MRVDLSPELLWRKTSRNWETEEKKVGNSGVTEGGEQWKTAGQSSEKGGKSVDKHQEKLEETEGREGG